jgi:putative transposase
MALFKTLEAFVVVKEPLRIPRASRYFLPGTFTAATKQFLLKFTRDRRRYLYWLLEAVKRFGLCVLNYTVTSNHVHFLLKSSDT